MRGWMVGLVAVAVLVSVAGVGAIAIVLSSGDATPIVELDVGDCFDLEAGDDDDGEVESVDLIECADPHLAEVVAIGELNADDSPYPTDEELFALVEQACRAADVVDSDAFGLLPVAPTPQLWDSFDGRYLCVAIPFGGDLVTGSIAAG